MESSLHWRAAASASTRQTSPAIAMDEDNEPRPSCNCKTSLCVRRYCRCFGSRWYCSDACRCESCRNTEAREAFVEERAEMSLKGKPGASQSKSCTCRKSECKKNYCECFKNRFACTERCQCEGCANTHGAKGGTVLLHNNGDSNGTSDGGSGTPHGSDGTSNETAVITDEGSLSPTEAEVKENSAAFLEPSNIGQQVYAPRLCFMVAQTPHHSVCWTLMSTVVAKKVPVEVDLYEADDLKNICIFALCSWH